MQKIHKKRAQDTLPVHRPVGVKIFVLDGYGGLLDRSGDLGERNNGALFFAVDLVEQHLAGAIVDLRGFEYLAVGQEVAARQIFNKDKEIQRDEKKDRKAAEQEIFRLEILLASGPE